MGSPTLLLVEDIEDVRELLKQAYEKMGFRVVTADSEEEAVRVARRSPPDLILIELGLPPLKMVDIGHRIRIEAALSAAQVPVVVWADRSDETVGEGEEVTVGSNTYIMLPEDGDQAQRFLLRLVSVEGAASGEVSAV